MLKFMTRKEHEIFEMGYFLVHGSGSPGVKVWQKMEALKYSNSSSSGTH